MASEEQFGNDSFLDVVCNMVGILIILVIAVGMKAHSSRAFFAQGAPTAKDEAEALALAERSQALDGDIARIVQEIRHLEIETAARGQERAVVAVAVAAARRELDQRRADLDAGQRELLELQQRLDAASRKLAELRAELEAPQSAPRPTVTVVSYPTPISKTVLDDEHHFQLRAGRVSYIPLEPLLDRLKRDLDQNIGKLRTTSELTDSVGPVDGFRLRYTLERVDPSLEGQIATGRSGSYVRLVEWTLVPVASDFGETVAEALQPGSRFAADLGGLDPKRATITIWVYPDSFGDFRTLKELLHKRGFATAGRPLPEGMPISGSPDGSRSSAQ